VNKPKLNIKKLLATLLWCSIAVCGVVLLVAAVRSKNVQTCKGVEIEISGVNNNFFIDKSDVLSIIKDNVGGKPQGKMISAFNLREIEQSLEQDVWIRNAELFFDNNEILRVDVDEREPVARIFSTDGKSFYIDSSLKILPLSEKFSARLPVFTGFSHGSARLTKADSNLLREIMDISMVMQADSFLMAMVEQVDITSQSSFEMVPKIGNQLIVFGDAMDAEEKFNKLKLFYKEVISKSGWSKYSIINLQYKNQVVAKIKDAVDKSSDSLRTLQIMQLIAERAASQASDSVQTFMQDTERNSADSSLIQQSMQRDEPQQSSGLMENSSAPGSTAVVAPMAPVITTEPPKPAPVKSAAVKISKSTVAKKAVIPAKPITKKPVAKPAIKPVIKPVPKPTTTTTTQPKAVMQKKQ
jgi:cell division protein FtsQ